MLRVYNELRPPPRRHSGSPSSDSGVGYPESPKSKPQMDYFKNVAHGIKEGDSGYFLPPGAGRYTTENSGMTAGGGTSCIRIRVEEKRAIPPLF